MPEIFGFAYSPRQVAERVNDVCVVKARLPLLSQWMLSMLAGAFLGLGALGCTLAASDASLGFAASRVLGSVCFFVGAAGLAILVFLSGRPWLNAQAIAQQTVRIAEAEAALSVTEAFSRGVLCKVLVRMAVSMARAGRSVVDRMVAIVFPIPAFVAAGFEHSIANMCFFPLAMLLGARLGWGDFAGNLVPVIAGNLAGGSVLVALVYYVIYIRPARGAGK